tara:strand:+ start:4045 stop:4170 length:126 start_codon:yes stop_codon:yes gene_type:complete
MQVPIEIQQEPKAPALRFEMLDLKPGDFASGNPDALNTSGV